MHIQCGSRLRMAKVYLYLTLQYIKVQCSYICIDCHLFCRTTSLGGAVGEGNCGPPQDKSGGTSTANQCQGKGSERGGEVYTEHDTQPPYSYIPRDTIHTITSFQFSQQRPNHHYENPPFSAPLSPPQQPGITYPGDSPTGCMPIDATQSRKALLGFCTDREEAAGFLPHSC